MATTQSTMNAGTSHAPNNCAHGAASDVSTLSIDSSRPSFSRCPRNSITGRVQRGIDDGLEHRTSNVELPTSNKVAFDVRRWTFDVGRWTFDVRRSTFDVRHSTFDV